MTIDINHDKHYIDIWLAHGEALPDTKLLQEARKEDYDVIVWRSGSGNLAALTSALLRNNR